MAQSSKVWSVMSLVAALAAAAIAKKGLNTSWRAATGKNPPANPADPDVDLWEAVLWAVASGTAVQLARMLATRKAAIASYKRLIDTLATPGLPPQSPLPS